MSPPFLSSTATPASTSVFSLSSSFALNLGSGSCDWAGGSPFDSYRMYSLFSLRLHYGPVFDVGGQSNPIYSNQLGEKTIPMEPKLTELE